MAMAVTSAVFYTGTGIPNQLGVAQSISSALFTLQVPVVITQKTADTIVLYDSPVLWLESWFQANRYCTWLPLVTTDLYNYYGITL